MKSGQNVLCTFIFKTVDILLISSFITKKCPDYWYLMHLRCWFARKMSQFLHFCGVKCLAWKSGCVKFLTNSMSAPVPHCILLLPQRQWTLQTPYCLLAYDDWWIDRSKLILDLAKEKILQNLAFMLSLVSKSHINLFFL